MAPVEQGNGSVIGTLMPGVEPVDAINLGNHFGN